MNIGAAAKELISQSVYTGISDSNIYHLSMKESDPEPECALVYAFINYFKNELVIDEEYQKRIFGDHGQAIGFLRAYCWRFCDSMSLVFDSE